MGPMDILLLALLLLWAVLALRRMRRHGSCTCSSCGSFAQSSRRRTTSRRSVSSRRSGGSRRSVSSRRSVGARREDPGDGAPLPFAKSENRTK